MKEDGKYDKNGFLFRSLLMALDIAEEGIIIVGQFGLVEYMNKAAEVLFNPLSKHADNQTFIEVVRDYECNLLLHRCMETGLEQTATVRLPRNDKFIKMTITPEENGDYYVIVLTDLTERQLLDDMKRDLISNISHELRTPVTSIKLLVETITNHCITDPARLDEFVNKIDIEADKITQLADELKELDRLEKHGYNADKSVCKIGAIIERAVGRLEPQAKRKHIEIIVEIEETLPLLMIDGRRIESVLVNVIHNAIKFTGQGGRIIVRARKDVDDLMVSVQDNGKGIPAGELNRIFERFYKVDRSRSDEGSGLGLSISKHIIADHGGRIWAESEEGKGSVFYFTLPIRG